VFSAQVLQCLLHCADLGNPGKPEHLAVQWTNHLVEEFFRQGDKERELNIQVHPSGDRMNTCIPSFQVGRWSLGGAMGVVS